MDKIAILLIFLVILVAIFGLSGLIWWGIGSFAVWAFGIDFVWTFWHGLAVAFIVNGLSGLITIKTKE